MRAALQMALAGKRAPLEDLLCRHGGGHDRAPNLKLAAAFGVEIAALVGAVAPLLSRLGEDDAAPDTPRIFLPIAAAHGWVGRLRSGHEVPQAWAALFELAADERGPVRLGTLDALRSFAIRPGGADALVEQAAGWLEDEDRERCFAAAALVIELYADRQVLAALSAGGPLLDYMARAIDAVAGASRAAQRSEGRRRALLSLPRTLAAVVAQFAGGDEGPAWMVGVCTETRHPDVRAVLSDAIVLLTTKARGGAGQVPSAALDRLRIALTGSAKPPRDPTRIRPGSNRGKASRRMR